jgi:hypothetical protein
MKKIFLSLLFSFSATALWAQGIMTFPKETHDFGDIEEGTVATYEFEFTNTGDQPIEIARVQASCGCTTPEWTNKPIHPGEQGKIKASYNSEGRPGIFNKSIVVYNNSRKEMLSLFIKGFVKPKNAVAQESPKFETKINLAPPVIQVSKVEHDFGKVQAGERIKERFFIHNLGQNTLMIQAIENQNKAISFGISTVTISPNDPALLDITVESDKLQLLSDDLILRTNDPKNPTLTIKLKGEIIEDFSKQMFKAPKN